MPNNNFPTFLYIPGSSHKGKQYGPIWVSPSAHMMTDFELVPLSGPVSDYPRIEEDPMQTIVLTPCVGTGTREDTRRPEVADDYPLEGYADRTSLPYWEKDEPCPYYGYLVAIKANTDIIKKIQKDPKYMVLTTDNASLEEVPGENWFNILKNWLVMRGMPLNRAMEFVSSAQRLPIKQVIDKLKELLLQPKQ